MKLTNRGIINANQAINTRQTNTLTIDPTDGTQGVINSGTIKATADGMLILKGGTFDNFEGTTDGNILADNATVDVFNATVTGGTVSTIGSGKLKLGSGTITGGTVNNSATGTILAFSGTNELGGTVTNATGGRIIVGNYSTLRLTGSSTYTNNGDLALNTTTGHADLQVKGGNVTLGGAGTITLSNNGYNHILGNTNSDRLILGGGQRLSGAGQIGVNRMKLTNRGIINANQAINTRQTNTLTIDVTGSTFSNEGVLRASNGGKLKLQDSTFTNTNTVEVAGTTSQVIAAGSYTQSAGTTRLSGGTLTTTGTADFTGGTLTGSGTLAVAGGTTFGTGATISPGASPGILNFTTATTFDGVIYIELGGTNVDGSNPNATVINTATDPTTTQYDQINVFGNATLNQGLTIDLASFGAFNPGANDFFDVLTANSFNGAVDLTTLNFTSTDFNLADFTRQIITLPDGQDGTMRQTLRFTYLSSVPIPAAFWLFFSGLLGVFGLAKRNNFAMQL